jgi:hypothetical protein
VQEAGDAPEELEHAVMSTSSCVMALAKGEERINRLHRIFSASPSYMYMMLAATKGGGRLVHVPSRGVGLREDGHEQNQPRAKHCVM